MLLKKITADHMTYVDQSNGSFKFIAWKIFLTHQ